MKTAVFAPSPLKLIKFWREQGWVVGEAFRLEQGIMFAEIVSRCEEYLLEHPESSMLLPLTEQHLAWCLIKLLDYGMAVPVVTTVSLA